MIFRSALPTFLLSAAAAQLTFNDDGILKIVQFADLHSHDGDDSDNSALAFMSSVLKSEQPDLVVYTGDNNDGGATEGVADSVAKFLKPTLSAKIPFAAIFGNHDEEADLTRDLLMDQYTNKDNFLGLSGPIDIHGYGNYILNVNKKGDEIPSFNLYFLDSGDYSKFGNGNTNIDGYDWIWGDQMDWYSSSSKALEEAANKTNPAFAFFHIPLPEYTEMINANTTISGDREEAECPGAVNSGTFSTFVERQEVKAITVGHDHCNDYCGNYHGIELCYGGHTGYGGYNCEGLPNHYQRSRIIEISDFGNTIRSYKVLDDGKLTVKDDEILWAEDESKLDRSNRKQLLRSDVLKKVQNSDPSN